MGKKDNTQYKKGTKITKQNLASAFNSVVEGAYTLPQVSEAVMAALQQQRITEQDVEQAIEKPDFFLGLKGIKNTVQLHGIILNLALKEAVGSKDELKIGLIALTLSTVKFSKFSSITRFSLSNLLLQAQESETFTSWVSKHLFKTALENDNVHNVKKPPRPDTSHIVMRTPSLPTIDNKAKGTEGPGRHMSAPAGPFAARSLTDAGDSGLGEDEVQRICEI